MCSRVSISAISGFDQPESVVDATLACGVKGDGMADDLPALQKCVNANANKNASFLPKGHYRLSSTLVLPPDTVSGSKVK